MNILITGTTGFLGSFLAKYFSKNHNIIAQSRNNHSNENNNIQQITMDLNANLNLKKLGNIDTIIHCAGQAHVMSNKSTPLIHQYREANVLATINLANEAINCGVKRFIFISSSKVNGESTSTIPFTPDTPSSLLPLLTDAYAISKCEAEIELLKLAATSNLEIVILRPVLIYGPNVKASFNTMIKLASCKFPLPIGCLDNKRSLVSIYNLASFIDVCLTHTKACNEIFLVDDQDTISVKEVFTYLAQEQNNRLISLTIPKVLLTYTGIILHKQDIFQRLCNEYVTDSSKNTSLLSWSAPYTVRQSIHKMFNDI